MVHLLPWSAGDSICIYILHIFVLMYYISIFILSPRGAGDQIFFSRTGNSIEVKRSRWETNLNIDTHALLQKGKWDGKSLKISHRQS